jgi:hypothetical protein
MRDRIFTSSYNTYTDKFLEVRLMIYEEAVEVPQGTRIILKRTSEKNPLGNGRTGSTDCFNLLQSSRQIRAEFHQLYYKHTHLAIANADVPLFFAELRAKKLSVSKLTVLVEDTIIEPAPNPRVAVAIRAGLRGSRDFLPLIQTVFGQQTQLNTEVAHSAHTAHDLAIATSTDRALHVLLRGSEEFKQAVRKKQISRIVIDKPLGGLTKIRIVFKTPHEEPWMRKWLGIDAEADQHSIKLGFVENGQNSVPLHIRISYGVKY